MILIGIADIGSYEYNPLAPIADAGPEQTVEGSSDVMLDGAGFFVRNARL